MGHRDIFFCDWCEREVREEWLHTVEEPCAAVNGMSREKSDVCHKCREAVLHAYNAARYAQDTPASRASGAEGGE